MSTDDRLDIRNDHQMRLASVGQIAAGIAHEVRNPLTAVKGFLQLLQQKAPHQYLEIAQQELENAISTLQSLLNVSKPDLEEEPLTRFSLCAELESILSLFQDQVYRVTIEKSFEDDGIEISGKRNQLKKAFFNILKNAFEAIPGEGTIRIRHFLQNRQVCVVISDTGVGIPPEKRLLLGTPFFTTKSDGTGMGLAYVYSIVYQHGGTIEVDSENGRGTTFTFRFPLHAAGDRGVNPLDLTYEPEMSLKAFMNANQDRFQERLFREALSVAELTEEIKRVGSIDLIRNAHKLVQLMIDHREMEIIDFAQQEGRQWAAHCSLNLALKLEWFQAVRQVLWEFVQRYEMLSDQPVDRDRFFALEKQINVSLDSFLRHFFMSYAAYKDELIKTHESLIEDLSAPLIPLTPSVAILPLLGAIDVQRAHVIRQKIFSQIDASQIRTLLIDLSGVTMLDPPVVRPLFKILDGIRYMGCRAIVTGIRAEIVGTIVDKAHSALRRIETKSTLQQALAELGFTSGAAPL